MRAYLLLRSWEIEIQSSILTPRLINKIHYNRIMYYDSSTTVVSNSIAFQPGYYDNNVHNPCV